MKKINLLALLICACLLMSCLAACSHSNVTVDSDNETSITENESFREQMDIAMKNASKQEVIAKVNDIKITQTQKDVYLISDKNITTDELIRKIIIADYSEKNGLNINSAAKARIDRAKKDMENDNTINEDYCQRTYGISKEAVIDYMQTEVIKFGMRQHFQIWLLNKFHRVNVQNFIPACRKHTNNLNEINQVKVLKLGMTLKKLTMK